MGVTSKITTEKPRALEVIPANIPDFIKEIPRWVCWRYEFLNGKWSKPPINSKTGVIASLNDEKVFGERDFKGGVPWGGMSADVKNGIVYLTTGNPKPNFVGTSRPGKTVPRALQQRDRSL